MTLLEGDERQALRWLMTAHASGMPGLGLIETDTLFDDLRGTSEFEDVLQRLRWRQNQIRARLGYGLRADGGR